jgi:hypothetical protein
MARKQLQLEDDDIDVDELFNSYDPIPNKRVSPQSNEPTRQNSEDNFHPSMFDNEDLFGLEDQLLDKIDDDSNDDIDIDELFDSYVPENSTRTNKGLPQSNQPTRQNINRPYKKKNTRVKKVKKGQKRGLDLVKIRSELSADIQTFDRLLSEHKIEETPQEVMTKKEHWKWKLNEKGERGETLFELQTLVNKLPPDVKSRFIEDYNKGVGNTPIEHEPDVASKQKEKYMRNLTRRKKTQREHKTRHKEITGPNGERIFGSNGEPIAGPSGDQTRNHPVLSPNKEEDDAYLTSLGLNLAKVPKDQDQRRKFIDNLKAQNKGKPSVTEKENDDEQATKQGVSEQATKQGVSEQATKQGVSEQATKQGVSEEEMDDFMMGFAEKYNL